MSLFDVLVFAFMLSFVFRHIIGTISRFKEVFGREKVRLSVPRD